MFLRTVLLLLFCGVAPLSKLRPGFAKVGAFHGLGESFLTKLLAGEDPDLSTHVLIAAPVAGFTHFQLDHYRPPIL